MAAWGYDVASDVRDGQDTPTMPRPVVVTFRGVAFLMCLSAPPPFIGLFRATNPAWVAYGPNVYAYVMQNPWTSWDPHGLWQFDEHWQMTMNAAKEAGVGVGMRMNLEKGVLTPDMPEGLVGSGYQYKVGKSPGSLTMRTHHGDLQPWHFMGRTGTDSPQDVKNNAIDFMMKNVETFRNERGGIREMGSVCKYLTIKSANDGGYKN